MSNLTSSPSAEAIPATTANAVGVDASEALPGSTVIADQESCWQHLVDRLLGFYDQATGYISPLLNFSKYGLGVALILCVTVIWVASSEWIQYIFGSLEYNKPFFLTYFNTTGFCLWNAGYLLSPKWRRTPWDEEAKNQPICIEDARIESKENRRRHAEEHPHEGERDAVGPAVPTTAAASAATLVTRGVARRGLPTLQLGESRNASVNLTLSYAIANRTVAPETRPPPSAATVRTNAELPLHVSPRSLSTPSYGTSASSQAARPLLPPLPAQHYLPPPASHVPNDQLSGGGGNESVLGDNDDADMESDRSAEEVNAAAAARLDMADEYRDYSFPSSFASSAQEEVVSVLLTDNDDPDSAERPGADSNSRSCSAAAAGTTAAAPSMPPLPVEAAHRSTVISSALLRHDQGGMPHRRHYHQRARRQRVLRYSLRRIWTCALYFCPFWFLANYLFNLSLSITSVASNTILSSTSSIWTLLLSYVMLREPVGLHRIVAIGMTVGGSAMVGLADNGGSGSHNTLGGDAVALLSAFFYAVYTSVLKWQLPDDERYAMGMVFGAVGIFNLLFLWPGLVVLGVSGAEPFAWPNWHQFWPLLMNALIGTNLSDVLWARSVVLTSPVVATLGLSLTTPLAMIVDAVFKHASFNGLYVAGAILVMAGFILANLPISINLGV